MFPNGRSVEPPAAMPAADPDRRAGAGSAPAAIMPGAGSRDMGRAIRHRPGASPAGRTTPAQHPPRSSPRPLPGRQIRQPVPHPRRPRQGRRRLRGAQGEHPGRGQEQHPDEGHDHALRAVRRGRARPDLRAHPRGLARARSSGRRLGGPKGLPGRLHGSTARRTEIQRFIELGQAEPLGQ